MGPPLETVLCPKCTYPGGLVLEKRLIAKPVGSFPLAGNQMKLSAVLAPVLKCTLPGCGMVLVGRIERGYAVFPDPHVVPEGR